MEAERGRGWPLERAGGSWDAHMRIRMVREIFQVEAMRPSRSVRNTLWTTSPGLKGEVQMEAWRSEEGGWRRGSGRQGAVTSDSGDETAVDDAAAGFFASW